MGVNVFGIMSDCLQEDRILHKKVPVEWYISLDTVVVRSLVLSRLAVTDEAEIRLLHAIKEYIDY